RMRQRETDAHVAVAVTPVRGVDPDVDRLFGVHKGPDPAADAHRVATGRGDRVDPAADAALCLALVHRYVGLAERPGEQGAIQQVPRPYPQPPLRHDVQPEPGRVLVELPYRLVDAGRVEPRPGQLVQRRHDADIGGVRHVRPAHRVG